MQTKRQSSGVIAGILLPMGLVCLFAFCSLALALLGGQAYKNIQAGVDENHGTNVAAAYLRTKIGQAARTDEVLLREDAGVQMLIIRTHLGKTPYETRIYAFDGKLMESFGTADAVFYPAGGVTITQLQSCTFTLGDDGLFTAEIVGSNGTVTRTAFALAQGGTL